MNYRALRCPWSTPDSKSNCIGMRFTTTNMIKHWMEYHHLQDLSGLVEQDTECGSLQIPLNVRGGFENGKCNKQYLACQDVANANI
jgi:hypothetical protein